MVLHGWQSWLVLAAEGDALVRDDERAEGLSVAAATNTPTRVVTAEFRECSHYALVVSTRRTGVLGRQRAASAVSPEGLTAVAAD